MVTVGKSVRGVRNKLRLLTNSFLETILPGSLGLRKGVWFENVVNRLALKGDAAKPPEANFNAQWVNGLGD